MGRRGFCGGGPLFAKGSPPPRPHPLKFLLPQGTPQTYQGTG
ncbi:hypothetical protein DWUX_2290 [Desulfovibrio diazotrophicus]|nr:hypothetical protein DWUX_2290 [Desulfovibrio diazotrophicus]